MNTPTAPTLPRTAATAVVRLAQRDFGEHRWVPAPAVPDHELAARGWALAGPARDLSPLADSERETLLALLTDPRPKDETPEQARVRATLEHRLLSRCPFTLFAPPLDLDVRHDAADASESSRDAALRLELALHELGLVVGRVAWHRTNERGGLHGELVLPDGLSHPFALLAVGELARRAARKAGVPLLSDHRARDSRPPVVLDDTLFVRYPAGRGCVWRLPGSRKHGGYPKTSWSLGANGPCTVRQTPGSWALVPLRRELEQLEARNADLSFDRARPAAAPPQTGGWRGLDTERPLSRRARTFLETGAPVGLQRREALGVGRYLLSNGYSVAETVDLVWRGLSASPWAGAPWTLDQARRLVESLAAAPPTVPPPPQRAQRRPRHEAEERAACGAPAPELEQDNVGDAWEPDTDKRDERERWRARAALNRAWLRDVAAPAFARAGKSTISNRLRAAGRCGSIDVVTTCSACGNETGRGHWVDEDTLLCMRCARSRWKVIEAFLRENWPERLLACEAPLPETLPGYTLSGADRLALMRSLVEGTMRLFGNRPAALRWFFGHPDRVLFFAAPTGDLEPGQRMLDDRELGIYVRVSCTVEPSPLALHLRQAPTQPRCRAVSRKEAIDMLRVAYLMRARTVNRAIRDQDTAALVDLPWLAHDDGRIVITRGNTRAEGRAATEKTPERKARLPWPSNDQIRAACSARAREKRGGVAPGVSPCHGAPEDYQLFHAATNTPLGSSGRPPAKKLIMQLLDERPDLERLEIERARRVLRL